MSRTVCGPTISKKPWTKHFAGARHACAAREVSITALAEDRMRLGIPRNVLERKAITALCAAGLPDPIRQFEVKLRGRTYYPDLSYPDRKIAIELEGEAPHWGRTRWQSDHDRDRVFELEGWCVLSYTWKDTTENAVRFVTQVGEILGLRPTRWKSEAPPRSRRDRSVREESR